MRKKVLYTSLTVFFILDVLIIIFLLSKTKLFSKKEFSSSGVVRIVNPNEINIKKGEISSEHIILTEATMNVYLASNPYVESGEYKIKIVAQNKKRQNVEATLILGKGTDRVILLKAPRGFVPQKINWLGLSVTQSASYLKKDTPLQVRIIYEKNPLISRPLPNCNEDCKKILPRVTAFYENNNKFIEAINEGKRIDNLPIGPVTALLVYDEE